MGNYYLLNAIEGWAAVCISKNACTSLKAAVLASCGVSLPDKNSIQNRIGYDARSTFLSSVERGRLTGSIHFAVWRDPVDRFLSAWQHFGVEKNPGKLAGWPSDLDAWIERTTRELKEPILYQDEHLRRQVDYYSERDIDRIVPIHHLSAWFSSMGWNRPPRLNVSHRQRHKLTELQTTALRELYAADDGLISSPYFFKHNSGVTLE